MKKYKWLIILGVIILALILIIVIFSENESKYIKELSINKVIKKIENEDTFMLYIKSDTCHNCTEFSPKFVSVLKNNNLKAYSLNITNFSDSEQELYNKTFKVEGTPTVLLYIDGNESIIKIEGNGSKEKIISKLESAGFINQNSN